MIKRIFLVLFFLSFVNAYALTKDYLVDFTLAQKELEKPQAIEKCNFQDLDQVKINLKIITPIKSEKELYEGQILEFRLVNNLRYKRQTLALAGDIAKARVETIITNGMNGIPASVILGNFEVDNLDKNKFSMQYEKFGRDLSLLVYPIKWMLTILPPTGSLTNFIKGGHVKFKKNDIITIYYYPKW